MKTVLFVCTGNICRSPMAEALLREAMPEINVASAGVYAAQGMSASHYAIEVLAEEGIDFTAFRSQPVTTELVAASDVIFAMTHQHRSILVSDYPSERKKIFLTKEFSAMPGDVADPYSHNLAVYRHCRDEIRSCLPSIIKFLQ